MIGKVIIFLLGIIAPLILSAQRFDANWPIGTNEYANAGGYGNAIIRFQADSIIVEKAGLNMNFESTVGAISDTLGNLLFFTNGCYIATASGDTMPNGEGLNPGEVHDWVCPENGYISHRGAMVIPMPGSNHLFYVFHMGVHYDPGKKLQYGPFYNSVVDIILNNGQGAVISKNNVLVDGILEPFSVTRHGNGRDWWILVPEYNTNRYRRFIITPDGVFEKPWIEAGGALNCLRVGSSAFSPDGQKFARQQNCKTLVFDFDRCSGILSNPIALSTPEFAFGGGGVAFSPDGNLLYSTTQMAILSADLEVPNPTFDTLISTEAITGAGLHFMQYTPDAKRIFISILHRSRFFSSLDSLDSPLPIFKQNGLPLPVYSIRTLPHFPNFRLYDLPGSSCDTLGINAPVSIIEPSAKKQERLILYPNPATDRLQIALPSEWHGIGHITLINTSGQVLRSEKRDIRNGVLELPLGSLPNGIYVCRVAAENRWPLSAIFTIMR